MILNKDRVVGYLEKALDQKDLETIKNRVVVFKDNVKSTRVDKKGFLNITSNGSGTVTMNNGYLMMELDQILETQTLERTKYYIERLIKAISMVKTGRVNDINLNRWKEYDDIITDSLWIFSKRDNSGAHIASYWGNFIPQIPNQFLKRYTKKGEWVLDPFLGSGTTLIECRRLGRNGIGVELQRRIANAAEQLIGEEKNKFKVKTEVMTGDSTNLDFKKEIDKLGIKSVQFLIMHPPYWDIIRFSNDRRDLSNAESVDKFLNMFGQVIDKTYPILDKGRYFAVVIGDKYSRGEWIPLSFKCIEEVSKRGYQLKSIIVKNFDETKGKMNQQELWRYRALVGGFYIFKHEYILLFKKK